VEEMASVAAMLSAERIFIPNRNDRGPRQDQPAGVPSTVLALDKERVGDHVLLLRLWEAWEEAGHSAQFCHHHGLQLRAMNFAKDVRRQLSGVVGPGRGRGNLGQRVQSNERGTGHTNTRADRSRSRSAERKREKKEKKDRKDKRDRKDKGESDRYRGRSPRRQRSDSPLPHHSSAGGSEGQRGCNGDSRLVRRALCVGFANRLARRMMAHNGYKTYNEKGTLAQIHPSSTHLGADREGLYPEWIIYHELVATSRPFLRQVCAVEANWVETLLPRLRGVDVQRLSGRAQQPIAEKSKDSHGGSALVPEKEAKSKPSVASGALAADAARERYLQRKAAKAAEKQK